MPAVEENLNTAGRAGNVVGTTAHQRDDVVIELVHLELLQVRFEGDLGVVVALGRRDLRRLVLRHVVDPRLNRHK